jgi:DNA polymerase-3 subunit delta
MPVLVFAGDEEFELSRKVNDLRNSLVDPAWASMNFSRFENPTLAQITELASVLPFGPGNKVILIDKCELFTKRRSKGGDSESESTGKGKASELDRFAEAIASVADNTYLIFACPFNFDKTLRTAKAVSKHARLEEFQKERYFPGSRNPRLETWCNKEAKRFGATIDSEAIYYLLDGLDGDLRQTSSELEKAATMILPATHIKLETVKQLSPHHSHVFALAESWIGGRSSEALASAKELLSRQSALPVLAALQTLMTKWLSMRAVCDRINGELPSGPGLSRRELPLPELAKRVSAELKLHPFAAEKDLKRLSRIPTQLLIDKRIELTRLEDLVKTGQVPEQHALDLILLR